MTKLAFTIIALVVLATCCFFQSSEGLKCYACSECHNSTKEEVTCQAPNNTSCYRSTISTWSDETQHFEPTYRHLGCSSQGTGDVDEKSNCFTSISFGISIDQCEDFCNYDLCNEGVAFKPSILFLTVPLLVYLLTPFL